MQVIKIQAEGRLKIGAEQIPVFLLENGTHAVNLSALYQYLTGKPGKGVRHALKLSNLNKHLPAKMLNAPEFSGVINDEEIRLFTSTELLQLCNAVVMASFKGHLSQTWQRAHLKVQLLLVAFASDGMEKVIARAIKNNPLLTAREFAQHMDMLLNYKYDSNRTT